MNVFDVVKDFYEHDPEWNTVLNQTDVENFLRSELWRGVSDEDIFIEWDYVLTFCVYVGNNDHYVGDMNRDDIIQCVAWCSRNVVDFIADAETVTSFLQCISNLYKYLASKHIVSAKTAEAPRQALERLVVNGQVQLIKSNGNFQPGNTWYESGATPDLDDRVYLNLNDNIDVLLNSARAFFSDEQFEGDLTVARERFNELGNDDLEDDELRDCFWDYFFFDHSLLELDITPFQLFSAMVMRNPAYRADEKINANAELLKDMADIHLAFFTIDSYVDEGMYACKDFLTGEKFLLALPGQEIDDAPEDTIFYGHLFHKRAMAMNCLQGAFILPSASRRMRGVMERAREWYSVRYGSLLTWPEFVNVCPDFMKKIVSLFSMCTPLNCFNHYTELKDYQPSEITEDFDEVMDKISDFLMATLLSNRDVRNCLRMWLDFCQAYGSKPVAGEHDSTSKWAAAVIKCYMDLNVAMSYSELSISRDYETKLTAIEFEVNAIKAALQLEVYDPRYVNEDGLSMMLID